MYDSIWILATLSQYKDSYAALQGCFHNTFLFPSTLKQTSHLSTGLFQVNSIRQILSYSVNMYQTLSWEDKDEHDSYYSPPPLQTLLRYNW